MRRGALLWNRVSITLLLAVLVCSVVALAARTRFFETVELNGFDRLLNAAGRPRPAEGIAFVDISDATVAAVKKWPIPRETVAQAIRAIARGGPALIGLDMQLAERRAPEEDRALAEALTEAGNVIIPCSRTEQGVVTEPLDEFRDAALDVALVNLYFDPDGAIRWVPLAVVLPNFKKVGFAVALATNHLGAPLERKAAGRYALGGTEISSEVHYVPSALIGQWSGPGLRVDLLDVIAPGFDPAVLRGKIVIFGESSKAGKDSFTTPLYGPEGGKQLVSGPEIHVAALATLLEGRTIGLVRGWGLWAVNFVAAALALALVIHGRPAWSVPVALALAGVVFGGALLLLTRQHLWLRYISTEAALLVSVPVALGYRFLRQSAQEKRLRELFGRYVSGEVLQEILRHPEQVAIEGRQRTATVLFTDIRGFTSTTAARPPEEVIAWLNEYFAAMSEVIKRNGGFLNKFIGDGLMVVFGAPVSQGEQKDAERAVRTGLEMLERLKELNRENAARAGDGAWRPPIGIGVGIHTGPVAAGSVGSPERMEYTVIGETVNLAARLESATRKFDVDVVISPATRKLVDERFETAPLGLAEAKGFTEQVEVYTVRSERSASRAV